MLSIKNPNTSVRVSHVDVAHCANDNQVECIYFVVFIFKPNENV